MDDLISRTVLYLSLTLTYDQALMIVACVTVVSVPRAREAREGMGRDKEQIIMDSIPLLASRAIRKETTAIMAGYVASKRQTNTLERAG